MVGRAATLTLVLLGLTMPARAAPLEAYGRLPSIENALLSPDGGKIALTVTNGEQRRIVVEDLTAGKTIANIDAGDQKLRWLQWAGSDHLIVTVSMTGRISDSVFVFEGPRAELFLATDLNLKTGRQRPLITSADEHDIVGHQENEHLNLLVGGPQVRVIEGRPYAYAQGISFVGNKGRLTMFKIDLDNAVTTIAARAEQTTDAFVMGPDGTPLAETEYDGSGGLWTAKTWRGHWQAALGRQAPVEHPRAVGLGRDGASVLISFPEDNHSVLREMAPDGSLSEPLPDVDPDQLIFDPASDRLVGSSTLRGDDIDVVFFDIDLQRDWKAITSAYPGNFVSLESFSADRKMFIVRVDSPAEGPAFALVNLTTGHARWLGDAYQGLKPADISPVRRVTFRAGDGLQITGYLTIPQGRDAKKLPLVVLPHGGPAVRDEPGFDWWSQGLAARGYAVLRVNYRGSDGFGWDFLAAGFGEWGRRMQTDLSDGVRWLATQGLIDPARVCIVGGSYGGYAALAGAALDPGVYRCAVAVAGVSDPRGFLDRDKALEGAQGAFEQRYWLRYMGPYERLGDISPASHADKVTIPILLIHGKDDTVVPYDQSVEMADALRRAGKPVDFVTLNHEDHWLSHGDTRLQMLQAVDAFLEKNNPP